MPDYKHMRKQQVVAAARQAKQERRRAEREERLRLAGLLGAEVVESNRQADRKQRREKEREQRRRRPSPAKQAHLRAVRRRRWRQVAWISGTVLAVLVAAGLIWFRSSI